MVEIGLFIQVGGALGLVPTLAIVIITAMIGTYLLRRQGLNIVMKVQAELQGGQMPVQNLIHGAFIVVAGLLLLTPGFFTDFIGFSLFIPQVRLMFASLIGRQFKQARTHKASESFEFHSTHYSQFSQTEQPYDVDIEGEFSVVGDVDVKNTKRIDDQEVDWMPS